MRTNRRVLLGTGFALAAFLAAPAHAAQPTASTIGASKPRVEWTGKTTLPAGAVYCLSSDDPICDNFFLESTSNGTVTVTLTAPGADDWDLIVYDDDGRVITSSADAGNVETVSFDVIEGARYEVDAAPFLTTSGRGYNAVGTWSA